MGRRSSARVTGVGALEDSLGDPQIRGELERRRVSNSVFVFLGSLFDRYFDSTYTRRENRTRSTLYTNGTTINTGANESGESYRACGLRRAKRKEEGYRNECTGGMPSPRDKTKVIRKCIARSRRNEGKEGREADQARKLNRCECADRSQDPITSDLGEGLIVDHGKNITANNE